MRKQTVAKVSLPCFPSFVPGLTFIYLWMYISPLQATSSKSELL